jgi:hypothetical protein
MSDLDVLAQRQKSLSAEIAHVEQYILMHRHAATAYVDPAFLAYDQRKAKIYLYLYTLPLLEIAGLLVPQRRSEAMRWGLLQFCMGMHIRYMDSVIDADEQVDALRTTHLSMVYYSRALTVLAETGMPWNETAEAMYMQYLLYEQEVQNGAKHSFGSLWRRVSPLCVFPMLMQARGMISTDDGRLFREFLSWSLVRADCDDGLRDYASNTLTPVVRLLREGLNGSPNNITQFVQVYHDLHSFLTAQKELLLIALQSRFPLWHLAFLYLEGESTLDFDTSVRAEV